MYYNGLLVSNRWLQMMQVSKNPTPKWGLILGACGIWAYMKPSLVILWLPSSDICFMLATAATCFLFHAGFYDASVKQAGFIEFSYIIYFYQMAHLICGSRFTIVRTIPVHNVGEYFIKKSTWINERIAAKNAAWFPKALLLLFWCLLEKVKSVLRDI